MVSLVQAVLQMGALSWSRSPQLQAPGMHFRSIFSISFPIIWKPQKLFASIWQQQLHASSILQWGSDNSSYLGHRIYQWVHRNPNHPTVTKAPSWSILQTEICSENIMKGKTGCGWPWKANVRKQETKGSSTYITLTPQKFKTCWESPLF